MTQRDAKPWTAGPWVAFFDDAVGTVIMPAGRPGDICLILSKNKHDADLLLAAPALAEAATNYIALFASMTEEQLRGVIADGLFNETWRIFPADAVAILAFRAALAAHGGA